MNDYSVEISSIWNKNILSYNHIFNLIKATEINLTESSQKLAFMELAVVGKN